MTNSNMKATTIRIDSDDLIKIKKIALDNNTNLSEIVRKHIKEIIEKGSLE